MIEHNDPTEVFSGDIKTGTLYSWKGIDSGGPYTASVLIPVNGDDQAHLKGSYDDGHGKKVDTSLPLTIIQGMWHLHQMHQGQGFKIHIDYDGSINDGNR